MPHYFSVFFAISTILFLSGCESLFFWPTRQLAPSPEVFKFEKQDRFFPVAEDDLIHAWQLPAKGEKQGTIYFLHGNGQNLSFHVANIYWLAEHGWEITLIDYRGYGRSVGEPDFTSVQEDALAGYQALISQRSDNLPVIVWGQSLGAAIAINMTASLPSSQRPQGLIIDSSFSSHRRIMQEVFGTSWLTWLFQYPLSWSVTDDYAPDLSISRIEQVPILIAHSEKDPLIDASHAKVLYDLANEPKKLWLTNEPGHITIWDNDDWRQKLLCQLASWPELKAPDSVCQASGVFAQVSK